MVAAAVALYVLLLAVAAARVNCFAVMSADVVCVPIA